MTITTKKTTSNETVITKIDFKPEENRGGTAARQEKGNRQKCLSQLIQIIVDRTPHYFVLNVSLF